MPIADWLPYPPLYIYIGFGLRVWNIDLYFDIFGSILTLLDRSLRHFDLSRGTVHFKSNDLLLWPLTVQFSSKNRSLSSTLRNVHFGPDSAVTLSIFIDKFPSSFKLSNFSQSFPTAAKLSNFGGPFQLHKKLSNFAWLFLTSLGSF